MPQNYFITGQPRTGKTTLLKELVAELRKGGLRIGGFVSPDERHHGTRTAFFVMDVETGKRARLASVEGDGPKVSKYHVDVAAFESIAVPSMMKASSFDIFVIDEIGVMEMKSARFASLLDDLMESGMPLIATLNERYVDEFGGEGEVLDLDSEDREQAFLSLLRKARAMSKRPAKAEKKEAPAPKKAGRKAPARKPSGEKKAGSARPKKAAKAAPKAKAPKKAPAPPPMKTKKAEAPREEGRKPGPPMEAPAAERVEEKETKEEVEHAGEREEERHKKKKEEMANAEEKEEKLHKKKKEGILGRLKKLFGG